MRIETREFTDGLFSQLRETSRRFLAQHREGNSLNQKVQTPDPDFVGTRSPRAARAASQNGFGEFKTASRAGECKG
jgi:hypothetical protein